MINVCFGSFRRKIKSLLDDTISVDMAEDKSYVRLYRKKAPLGGLKSFKLSKETCSQVFIWTLTTVLTVIIAFYVSEWLR